MIINLKYTSIMILNLTTYNLFKFISLKFFIAIKNVA